DKLDANHSDLLAALERHAHNSEHRLDQLELSLARLAERTPTETYRHQTSPKVTNGHYKRNESNRPPRAALVPRLPWAIFLRSPRDSPPKVMVPSGLARKGYGPFGTSHAR